MGTAQGKFYQLTMEERAKWLAERSSISVDEISALSGECGLSAEQANHMIENAVGVYALPLGIAQNFVINGREVLVAVAVEEPSVVAGASFMAGLTRSCGGFTANTTVPEMIGQMQILNLADPA